jgi:ribokinase
VASNVVVVGSVNVDMVFRVSRLPAPGETVTRGTFSRGPGGKGGNQAAAAARLGARTWFVSMVGDDDLGRGALRDLEVAGVQALVDTGASHTGVAGIFVDEAGENAIAVASGANAELDGEAVERALRGLDADAAVVLANLEVPDGAVMAAAEAAGERGWPFVLNPAPARPVPDGLLPRCALVVPNQGEAALLGGPEAILDGGAAAVAVTAGRAGAELYRPGHPMHHQPAFEVEVVDTTGAGDAFCAAVAWATAGGRPLEEAVAVGSAAGALACGAPGARGGLPAAAEVERLLDRQR